MTFAIHRRNLLSIAGIMAASTAVGALPSFALPTVEEVAFDPDIPALGNPYGDVTIVEFVDYQCPVCKLGFFELRKLLLEDRGVRLVMKDWPILGKASRYAAEMMLASGDGELYARGIDALMANRGTLSNSRTDDILASAGLDVAALRDRLSRNRSGTEALLSRNERQAEAFDLRGTPALLIGKRLYKRAMPVSELRDVVALARGA